MCTSSPHACVYICVYNHMSTYICMYNHMSMYIGVHNHMSYTCCSYDHTVFKVFDLLVLLYSRADAFVGL